MKHTRPLTDILVAVIQQLINAPEHASEQLLSVCFAVLTLETSGSLQSIPIDDRKKWAEYIQSYQQQANGLFGEHGQVETGEGTALEKVTLGALRSTHFALNALTALDWIASHQLRFVESFSSDGTDTLWLNELNWAECGKTSEWLMYLLGVLIYRAELETDRPSAALYHKILDWMENVQDQKSGLWGLKEGASLPEAIIAGCHLFPFFGYVNRSVMRVSHMADCCMHLLKSNYNILSEVSTEKCYSGIAARSLLSAIHQTSAFQRDEIAEVLLRSLQVMQNVFAESSGIFSEAQDQKILEVGEQPTVYDEFRQNPFLLACVYRVAVLEASSIADIETHPSITRARRQPILGCTWSRSNKTADEVSLQRIWQRSYRVPAHFQPLPSQHQPRISVVVPCYNLGTFLHEAIQSILDQTYLDLEILLVDDGSTDEYTRWVITQIDLPRTRLINQENRGLAAARNAGIRQARGDYICCLDPDDRLRPGYFASAIPILDTQHEVAIVTGWLKFFDEREGDYFYEEFNFADLLANNQVITPALFRRSAWEQVGGYSETFSSPGIEDWDFWISIYEAGYHAHLLPEVVYDYRIRADAMSTGMYEPDCWRRIIGELVQHHKAAYAEHLEVVLAKINFKWADARKWALDLGRGLSWWERQSGVWQHEAEQGNQRVSILENRIRDLEQQMEPSGLRQAVINELIAKAGDQPTGLIEQQPDVWMLRSIINELQDNVQKLEAERDDLQERLVELYQITSRLEWISPGRSSVGRTAWYKMGKRLGFIRSDPNNEGRPDDRP